MLVQVREFNFKMTYFEELKKSMDYLSNKRDTIFIGQAVEYAGTAMTNTLVDVQSEKLMEFPVCEEFQMGTSIGMAMNGFVPISIYPRWNFLVLSLNQILNHLDKIIDISNGGYSPKVIIRTSVGSERPLHPQDQHVGDFSDAFRLMLKNIEVIQLKEPEDIYSSYKRAYEREDGKSTILVEYGDFYNEK